MGEFPICSFEGVREIYRDDSEGEIPVPIPNTEVKSFSADGTLGAALWESKTLR